MKRIIKKADIEKLVYKKPKKLTKSEITTYKKRLNKTGFFVR